MRVCRMQYVALAAGVALLCCHAATAKTWRLKAGDGWESVDAAPQEQYLHAIAEIKRLVRAGESDAAGEAIEQLRDEFPDRVGPDLDLFIEGELHYWADHYGKALLKYEKLLKDHPGSEFADLALEREYEIAQAYLHGRKKTILGFMKISGVDEGIEIMERISDRAGLDETDSVGLKAAIAVAEHYERTEQYLEAYLKWSEIASYWETGPVGKRAMFRMAEDNFLAYNQPPEHRRPYFDASKLTTAQTYYTKFMQLYPQEADEHDIPAKLKQIDEQMAYKQFLIGQYYRRTGERRAAYLYFDMVVQNWPKTEAAGMARQAMNEFTGGEQASGE